MIGLLNESIVIEVEEKHGTECIDPAPSSQNHETSPYLQMINLEELIKSVQDGYILLENLDTPEKISRSIDLDELARSVKDGCDLLARVGPIQARKSASKKKLKKKTTKNVENKIQESLKAESDIEPCPYVDIPSVLPEIEIVVELIPTELLRLIKLQSAINFTSSSRPRVNRSRISSQDQAENQIPCCSKSLVAKKKPKHTKIFARRDPCHSNRKELSQKLIKKIVSRSRKTKSKVLYARRNRRLSSSGTKNDISSEIDEMIRIREIEKILTHKNVGTKTLYKIRWLGFKPLDDTWIEEKRLRSPIWKIFIESYWESLKSGSSKLVENHMSTRKPSTKTKKAARRSRVHPKTDSKTSSKSPTKLPVKNSGPNSDGDSKIDTTIASEEATINFNLSMIGDEHEIVESTIVLKNRIEAHVSKTIKLSPVKKKVKEVLISPTPSTSSYGSHCMKTYKLVFGGQDFLKLKMPSPRYEDPATSQLVDLKESDEESKNILEQQDAASSSKFDQMLTKWSKINPYGVNLAPIQEASTSNSTISSMRPSENLKHHAKKSHPQLKPLSDQVEYEELAKEPIEVQSPSEYVESFLPKLQKSGNSNKWLEDKLSQIKNPLANWLAKPKANLRKEDPKKTLPRPKTIDEVRRPMPNLNAYIWPSPRPSPAPTPVYGWDSTIPSPSNLPTTSPASTPGQHLLPSLSPAPSPKPQVPIWKASAASTLKASSSAVYDFNASNFVEELTARNTSSPVTYSTPNLPVSTSKLTSRPITSSSNTNAQNSNFLNMSFSDDETGSSKNSPIFNFLKK